MDMDYNYNWTINSVHWVYKHILWLLRCLLRFFFLEIKALLILKKLLALLAQQISFLPLPESQAVSNKYCW